MYLTTHQIASAREQAAALGNHALVELCERVELDRRAANLAAERTDACSCRECRDGIIRVGGRCPLGLGYEIASERLDASQRALSAAIAAAEIDTDDE